MIGDASEAVALHEGGEDGGATAIGGWASGSTGSSASSGIGTASSGSSSSLFSSTTWSVGDEEEDGDGATSSSSRPADRRHFSSLSSLSSLSSSTSSESEALQMNGAAAGGPLHGMSTMQDHLPPALGRTGLSMYYQGRSESFTSLADVVSCLEDLAKKTVPYIRRPKASRHHAAAALGVKNRLSKKALSGRKLAASECQGKRELYRC